MNWQIGPVTLPGDLEWTEELNWSPRKQAESISLAGSVLIQRSTQISGQPITLVTPQRVWVTREQVKALLDFAAEADSFMVTHPDGREIPARFRYAGSDGPVDAAPVIFRSPPIDSDPYTMTLRLMTV